MRGDNPKQEAMFSYVSPERRVPAEQHLRNSFKIHAPKNCAQFCAHSRYGHCDTHFPPPSPNPCKYKRGTPCPILSKLLIRRAATPSKQRVAGSNPAAAIRFLFPGRNESSPRAVDREGTDAAARIRK